jgi:XTP/dITP diphosphohydrolase
MTGKIIHFVTSNRSKFNALQQLVTQYGFAVKQVELPLIEPQQDAVEEVSRSKAEQAFERIHAPIVVEDSGFSIDGLAGFPAAYTRYVLGTIGVEGLLRLAEPLKSRTCRFISVLTYIDALENVVTFSDHNGTGTLAQTVDNTDCEEMWSDLWRIFIPDGVTKPVTALSKEERSHLLKKWVANSVYNQFAQWLQDQTK